MNYLLDELREYCSGNDYPLHMPGHKRRLFPAGCEAFYGLDITEIDGFDNLHHAEGILKEAQERAAQLYASEETFFLVNGSTCGILSAISACAEKKKILMARNCHKAAYHAVFLMDLQPVYLYPREGEVNGVIGPEQVRAALRQHPDAGAVFLTSPTYDGVVSDIREIAGAAHAAGIPLIVDEAHGAHFGMHPVFPSSSVQLGADLVIHSLHKTLPSLTQTALLHVNGTLVDRKRLRDFLDIYQSSSPSYLLMASMDSCIGILQERGAELFGRFAEQLERFGENISDLHCLKRLVTDDPSKVLIADNTGQLTGLELYQRLRNTYHLQPEMAAGSYVLALMSIGDEAEGFERLARALWELDRELEQQAEGGERSGESAKDPGACVQQLEAVYSIRQAAEVPAERVSLEHCAGRISAEYIYLYPPGIPLVVPGERIPPELQRQILEYRSSGYSLQGLADYDMNRILVAEQEKA